MILKSLYPLFIIYLITSWIFGLFAVLIIFNNVPELNIIWCLAIGSCFWLISAVTMTVTSFYLTHITIKDNLKNLEKNQNFCYSCGTYIFDKMENNICPSCSTNLNLKKILFETKKPS